MKIQHVTYYVCQFCGKKFATEKECKMHEAKEMNLDMLEYEWLLSLEQAEREAASSMAICNNEKTRKEHKKFSDLVLAFRLKHDLEPCDSIGV